MFTSLDTIPINLTDSDFDESLEDYDYNEIELSGCPEIPDGVELHEFLF